MGKIDYDNINDMCRDILRELGSIGTGNAATSISSMLGTSVSITLPEVSVLSFAKAMYYIGNPEDPVIGVCSRFTGELEGVMLFILRLDFASAMTELMMGKTLSTYDDIDEMAHSAFTEIGNIIISSYVTALSNLTDMEVRLLVPDTSINMLGGILNVPMVEVGYEADKLIMMSGKFVLGDKQHEGCVLTIPTVESLERILTKLGGL